MEVQLRRTSDQTDTLYVPSLEEHYHSVHGAWQESMHVFINEGFCQINKPAFTVFEMGFGTGLNTLLSIIEATKRELKVDYHSIDHQPLPKHIIDQLNYIRFLEPEFQPVFKTIHSYKWDSPEKVNTNFCLTKILDDILRYEFCYNYNLVFWDAFGPDKQPELWQTDLFKRIYTAMEPEGIFVTYSAKGIVRRNLEAAGFMVNKIPGPTGKREMIRARKLSG